MVVLSRLVLLCLFGFFQPASDELQELRDRLSRSEGEARISVLIQLAEKAAKSHPNQAITWGNQAIEEMVESPEDTDLLRLYVAFSRAHDARGDHEPAVTYALKALDIADRIDTPDAESFDRLARLFRSLERFSYAARCFERAAELYQDQNKGDKTAGLFNLAGVMYAKLGDSHRAMQRYLQSLQCCEAAQDEAQKARTLNNLGILYRSLGQGERALECYHRALDIKKTTGSPKEVARTLNNIGIVHCEMSRFEQALRYFQDALAIKRNQGDSDQIANTLTNMAIAYKQQGDVAQARDMFAEALTLYDQEGLTWPLANSLVDLATLNAEQGQNDRALDQAKRVVDLATELDAKGILSPAYHLMARIFETQGQTADALVAFKRAAEIDEALSGERTVKQIADLESGFEIDKREREIAALKIERNRKRLLRNAYLGGFIAALFFVGVLFWSNRQRRRANTELENSNHEIAAKNDALTELNQKLEAALTEVKQLSGLLPICAACKKIRDDSGDWVEIEAYLADRSEAEFSHGICPACTDSLYGKFLSDFKKKHPPKQDG